MKPSAFTRCQWRQPFVSALIVLGVISACAALVLLAQWGGRRAVRPLLGAGALFLACTAQSNRARVLFAAIGGGMIRG